MLIFSCVCLYIVVWNWILTWSISKCITRVDPWIYGHPYLRRIIFHPHAFNYKNQTNIDPEQHAKNKSITNYLKYLSIIRMKCFCNNALQIENIIHLVFVYVWITSCIASSLFVFSQRCWNTKRASCNATDNESLTKKSESRHEIFHDIVPFFMEFNNVGWCVFLGNGMLFSIKWCVILILIR